MNNYKITFKYLDDNSDYQTYSLPVRAESRMQAFDEAIKAFTNSIVLTSMIENGKQVY